MNLNAKLTIIFSTLATVIVLLSSAVGYVVAKDQLTREIQSDLTDAINSQVNQLDGWIFEKAKMLEITASTIQNSYGDDNITVPMLSGYKTVDSEVSDMYFGSVNGKMVDGSGWIPPQGYDPRNRPWYKSAINRDKLVFSAPYMDKVTNKLAISVGMRLKDKNGQVIGVFAEDILLKTLIEDVKAINLNGRGYAYLFDDNGLMLAHPDDTLINKNIFKMKSLDNLSTTFKEMMGRHSGFTTYNDNGISMLAVYQRLPSTGWTLAVVIPEELVFAPLVRLQLLMMLVAALAIIIGIFATYTFISSKVIRPLQELGSSAEKIANGNFSLRLNVESKDELGRLAEKFNVMAENIEAMMNKLQLQNQQLKQSEEKFSNIFNLIPDSVMITRLSDGIFIDVNEGYCQRSREPRAAIIGKPSMELGFGDNPADRKLFIQRLKRHGVINNMEMRARGRIGLVSARLVNIDGEDCILYVVRDVTEERLDENCERVVHDIAMLILMEVPLDDILYRVCEQFVSIFNLSSAWIGWKVPDGTVRIEAKAGVMAEYLEHLSRWDEDIDPAFPVTYVIQTGKPGIIQTGWTLNEDPLKELAGHNLIQHETGSCAAFPMIIRGETICGIGLVSPRENFWDARMVARLEQFADQVAVAINAAKSRDKLNILYTCLQTVDYAIGITDKDRNFEWVNPAFVKMFGYDYDEIIGKNLREFTNSISDIHHAKQTALQIREMLIADGSWHGELNQWRKDCSIFPADVTITVIKDDRGDIANIVNVFDITERKQAEEAIDTAREARSRAEKLFAMGTLSAGIAHEINQPLNSIKVIASGLSYASQSGKKRDIGEIVQQIEDISRQADRINNIINQLRQLLQRGELSKEPCDLNAAVEQVLWTMENRFTNSAIKLKKYLLDELPLISIAPIALDEIINNLLDNALQALDMVNRSDKEIFVSTAMMAGEVLLIISDNGPGISAEVGEKIFDPFFSSKTGGNNWGLGLAIVSSLLGSYGGSISYESDGNKGTMFTVKFPMAETKEMIGYAGITC